MPINIKPLLSLLFFTSIFITKCSGAQNNPKLKCIRNTYNSREDENRNFIQEIKSDIFEKYSNSMSLQLGYMKDSCKKVENAKFEEIFGDNIKELGSGAFGKVSRYCKDENQEDCIAVKEFNNFDQATTLFLAFKEFNNSICLRTFLPEKYLENFALIQECYYVFTGEGTGNFRFTMDYFPKTLQDLIEKPFNEKTKEEQVEMVYRMRKIAESVKIMHKYGFAHTDLKPQNILIDKENKIKLADFGTSTVESMIDKSLLGSPLFLDPEILNKESWSSLMRADVFSLGVLFSAMFSGKNYAEKLKAIIKEGNYFKKMKNVDSDVVYSPNIYDYYYPELFTWMRTMLQIGIRRMSLKRVIGRIGQYLKKNRYTSKTSENRKSESLKLERENNKNYNLFKNVDLRMFSKRRDFLQHPMNRLKRKRENTVKIKNGSKLKEMIANNLVRNVDISKYTRKKRKVKKDEKEGDNENKEFILI
jgi:serine/threonine protein kinase